MQHVIDYFRNNPMRSVYHHGALYAVVALLLIGLKLSDIDVPVFWPLLVWFFIAAIHFFIVKSLSVDDAWADEKADKLRRDAYDFQHVREIYNEPKTLERIAREREEKRKSEEIKDSTEQRD